MIDDSFVWKLCGFTAWRCIYSMHESSGSRVKFVVCQCLVIVMMY